MSVTLCGCWEHWNRPDPFPGQMAYEVAGFSFISLVLLLLVVFIKAVKRLIVWLILPFTAAVVTMSSGTLHPTVPYYLILHRLSKADYLAGHFVDVNCIFVCNFCIYRQGRDLMIAFICVAFTYICVAVVFYSCFPLQKNCIEDVGRVISLCCLLTDCKLVNPLVDLKTRLKSDVKRVTHLKWVSRSLEMKNHRAAWSPCRQFFCTG